MLISRAKAERPAEHDHRDGGLMVKAAGVPAQLCHWFIPSPDLRGASQWSPKIHLSLLPWYWNPTTLPGLQAT